MSFAGENYDDWSSAEQRIEQAHEFYERGELNEALRELQAAIDINPNNSNWHFNKGLTLDTLERYHEAIDSFEQARELAPEDPEILNCLGVDYTRVGQYQRAIEIFEQLQDTEPNFEPGYCNRIITYSELGQHEKAEEMFYLARQLREHCPLCYYNMGNSLFSRQLYDRAIWCWQQTKNLDPSHPQIDYRIAQGYWAKADHDQAKKSFLAELRRQPGDAEVLLDLGLLLLEMNELDGAKEKFHRILELKDDHAQVYLYLGELNLHQGQMADAMKNFQRALRINPSLPGAHFRLGECYLLMAQYANAREHLLAEMSLSPDQAEVLIELGCMLEKVNEIPHAMRCFERYIEMKPQDVAGYHNLSLTYYAAGLIDQGIELSQKVLSIQADHIPALHNLIFAHMLRKQFGAMREYLNAARQIAPEDASLKTLGRQAFLTVLTHRLTKPWRLLRSKFPAKK